MEETEKKTVLDKEVSRRNFLEWMGVGAVGGSIAAMGAFSYSPMRKQTLEQPKLCNKDM